MRSVSK